MNDWILLVGIFVLATAMSVPFIISDVLGERRAKQKRR